jgi:hypothetical protein
MTRSTPHAPPAARWTCSALVAAAALGAPLGARAESAAVVTVSPTGTAGARAGANGQASVRLMFTVIIPPRLDLEIDESSTNNLKARTNLKGKVVRTVDDSGPRPVHTVSIP